MSEKTDKTAEDEIEAEIVQEKTPDSYPWCGENNDERRRSFIAEIMANSEIDGRILVANMDAVYKWVKDGAILTDAKVKKSG